MTLDLLGYALIALIGIVFSAVFSGLETGLYTINRVRLIVRASHGERQAQRLRALINKPNRMLSTLLLGNNMANYAGSFGIAAILDYMGVTPAKAVAINAGILIPLLFVFGETLPKDLFRTYTDRWSYACAAFLHWTGRAMTWIGLIPIVQSFGDVAAKLLGADATAAVTARQRISQLINEGVGAGVLSESQTTLADRALAMRDMTVGAEMVPWRRVLYVPVDADDDERRGAFRRVPYSTAPVVDRNGRAIGILSMLDALLEPEKATRELMRETLTLHPAAPVREALQQMQDAACPMAIVVKPNTTRPIGIVTLKDLVEPLTGELSPW